MNSQTVYIHSISSIFDSPNRQLFSLPFGLISYITQNPKSAVGLQKLQKTCKFLYVKTKVVFIDDKINLHVGIDNYYYYQRKIRKFRKIYYIRFYFIGIKFWLTQTLICLVGIPKNIYRCTLESLTIYNQNLKSSEFDFLLNGGKLKKLYLAEIEIIQDANGISLLCYQILAKVPNIEEFEYSNKNEVFTNETFEKMNKLKFNSKIKTIIMSFFHFSPTIDLCHLCKFVKKNAAANSVFIFNFCMDNSNDYVHSFKTMVNDQLLPWMKKNKTWCVIGSGNEIEYIY